MVRLVLENQEDRDIAVFVLVRGAHMQWMILSSV